MTPLIKNLLNVLIKLMIVKELLINILQTMSEPSPTTCVQFSSVVIYFDEIYDNCKKHYIKKISLKFQRIKI